MLSYRILNQDIDEHGNLKEQYPEEIDGNFDCSQTHLKSLKGCPKKIHGNLSSSFTKLQSLIDGPEWVGTNYYCSNTQLTSLEGAAQYVGGDFYSAKNNITSLQGIGRKYLKQIDRMILLNECPLQSHVLGLLLIKNLQLFNFYNNTLLRGIINKHLEGDRDILECQEELINKGLKDYAKL